MATNLEIYSVSEIDASGNLPENSVGGKWGSNNYFPFDNMGIQSQIYEWPGGWHDASYRVVATQQYLAANNDLGRNYFPVDIYGTDSNNTLEGSLFVDHLYGGGGNDRLWGNDGSDILFGGDGNDVLNGGQDNNYLDGGNGNDLIQGGSGALVRVAAGTGYGPNGEWKGVPNTDTILDGDGNDIVYARGGDDLMIAGAGDDKYYGGKGFDTLDYSGATNAINVALNLKSVDGLGHDFVLGVEKFIGTKFNDHFDGNKEANTFVGGDGNNTFRGRGGADTFTGGAGKDTYQWQAKDVMLAGKHLGVDKITDFAKGDVLDLHKFFGKHATNTPVDSLVKITDDARGSHVHANIGGTFVEVVTLENVHGLSASALLHDGGLLT
jgi:Ca2+-binding RTX toxin-like protein